MKNDQLKTPERMFIYAVSFEEGIVPLELATMDVGRALKDLSPEDARKMKRKFRKMWRKLARQATARTKAEVELAAPIAIGKNCDPALVKDVSKKGHKPSKRAKMRRKELVQGYIMRERVYPMIEKFKKIERK